MALIKCYECGHLVSDKAQACPQCGAPVVSGQGTEQQGDYWSDDNKVYWSDEETIVSEPQNKTHQSDNNGYGEHPQTGWQGTNNQPASSNNRLLIALCLLLGLALVGVFVYKQNSDTPFFNTQSGSSENNSETSAYDDAGKEKMSADVETERKAVEEERIKLERQQLEAERKKLEAERQRAAEESVLYSTATGTYRGTINSPTIIRLNQQGNYLSGTSQYTKYNGPKLELNGSIDDSGYFDLYEYNGDLQTGYLSGRIQGKYMTGTFYNPITDKTFSFKLAR